MATYVANGFGPFKCGNGIRVKSALMLPDDAMRIASHPGVIDCRGGVNELPATPASSDQLVIIPHSEGGSHLLVTALA